jgi:hypothetical protein
MYSADPPLWMGEESQEIFVYDLTGQNVHKYSCGSQAVHKLIARKKHHVLGSHLMIKFHEYSGYGLPNRHGLSAFHGLASMKRKTKQMVTSGQIMFYFT